MTFPGPLHAPSSACEHEVNAGTVCFLLEGWERRALTRTRDLAWDDSIVREPRRLALTWVVLDPSYRVLTRDNLCDDPPPDLPAGAAWFVVESPPQRFPGPLHACHFPGTTGTVTVWSE